MVTAGEIICSEVENTKHQKSDGEEEEKKTREIIEEINRRRAERIKMHLPHWFLIYRRFRSIIYLGVVVVFDSLLVSYYYSGDGVISISIILAVILAYIALSVANWVISYLAFRKVPVEAYFQEDKSLLVVSANDCRSQVREGHEDDS